MTRQVRRAVVALIDRASGADPKQEHVAPWLRETAPPFRLPFNGTLSPDERRMVEQGIGYQANDYDE